MQAVIYSNGNQECERASMFLNSLGADCHEYLLEVDFSDKQFRAEFGKEAEYPQVSIDVEHIGGLKETLHYFNETYFINT